MGWLTRHRAMPRSPRTPLRPRGQHTRRRHTRRPAARSAGRWLRHPVRPGTPASKGRYIAGVCAAFGRATNTDPVLWRVVLPVLTVVGGLGGLLYLLGWLLIPAEGDTASPFEALIGRGHSSTSKAWTIVLSVVALSFLIGGFTSGPGSRFLLFAAVIGGAVLLVTSRDPRSGWRRPDPSRPAVAPRPGRRRSRRPGTGHAADARRRGRPRTVAPVRPAPRCPPPRRPTRPPFAPHGPFQPAGTFDHIGHHADRADASRPGRRRCRRRRRRAEAAPGPARDPVRGRAGASACWARCDAANAGAIPVAGLLRGGARRDRRRA